MAKKKVSAPVDDVAVADASEPAEEVQSDGKTSVTVTWSGGKRVYSRELHGADFNALAKEFAEKKGGKVA
jgi:hypothetical protein